MKLKKLFQNKVLLYLVLILAIINVVGYFTVNDINAVIFFILVGFLTTFFNKNMIIGVSYDQACTEPRLMEADF